MRSELDLTFRIKVTATVMLETRRAGSNRGGIVGGSALTGRRSSDILDSPFKYTPIPSISIGVR